MPHFDSRNDECECVAGRRTGAYNPRPVMFKRVRQLHISLAAKCQLLFGAAVVLIIGAALFVPWQRMEQLTEQLNERSARTLIEYTIDSHVNGAAGAVARQADTAATNRPAVLVFPRVPDPSAAQG